MKRWSVVLAIAIGSAVMLLSGWAVLVLREQGEMIRDAYCLDWASAAIVQYMDDHDGQYPKDWQELRKCYDKVTSRDHSFSFEEMQSRVFVDFGVETQKPYDESFRFVWLRSGGGARWTSPDPNDRIRTRIQASLVGVKAHAESLEPRRGERQ